jgi:hypothetical protein
MSQPLAKENPGAGTPGLLSQTKNQPHENTRLSEDLQLIARDGGWEFSSILVGCAVAAMAAFSGGSAEEIRESLRCARLALLEAIEALREIEGGAP